MNENFPIARTAPRYHHENRKLWFQHHMNRNKLSNSETWTIVKNLMTSQVLSRKSRKHAISIYFPKIPIKSRDINITCTETFTQIARTAISSTQNSEKVRYQHHQNIIRPKSSPKTLSRHQIKKRIGITLIVWVRILIKIAKTSYLQIL